MYRYFIRWALHWSCASNLVLPTLPFTLHAGTPIGLRSVEQDSRQQGQWRQGAASSVSSGPAASKGKGGAGSGPSTGKHRSFLQAGLPIYHPTPHQTSRQPCAKTQNPTSDNPAPKLGAAHLRPLEFKYLVQGRYSLFASLAASGKGKNSWLSNTTQAEGR